MKSEKDIQYCDDCGTQIGLDKGPPEGWQMEDGRTVCQRCCCGEFSKFCDNVIALHRSTKVPH